jgi:hypothetical protein
LSSGSAAGKRAAGRQRAAGSGQRAAGSGRPLIKRAGGYSVIEDLAAHLSRLDPAEGQTGLYLMRSRFAASLTPEMGERIKRQWAHAWESIGRQAPGLLILDSNLSVEPLADAELRELGLMRIPMAFE